MKKSFTLIELIFVIVALGILVSIVLPKFSEISKQSYISQAKSTYAAVQGGIQNLKTKNVLTGKNPYPASLDNGGIFGAVLSKPVKAGRNPGEWEALGNNTYKFHVGDSDYIIFTYNSTTGKFECDSSTSTIPNICNNF